MIQGLNSVPWQPGHGGMVSVESSSVTNFPQLTHLYVPFPGFSPVVVIGNLL